MTKPIPTILMSALLLVGIAGPVLAAPDTPPATTAVHATADDAQRAKALLARAVAAYSKDPKRALVDFMMVVPSSTTNSTFMSLAKTASCAPAAVPR